MRKNAIILLVAVLQFLIINSAKAQEVKISGELRLRYEMQHGYKSLARVMIAFSPVFYNTTK
jgi:hypothetical protein